MQWFYGSGNAKIFFKHIDSHLYFTLDRFSLWFKQRLKSPSFLSKNDRKNVSSTRLITLDLSPFLFKQRLKSPSLFSWKDSKNDSSLRPSFDFFRSVRLHGNGKRRNTSVEIGSVRNANFSWLNSHTTRQGQASSNDHGTKNDISSRTFLFASVPVRKETEKN